METKQGITLTAIMIPDASGRGFTGFFAEMPEVITQGSTQGETENNLFVALQTMLQFHKEERHTDISDVSKNVKPTNIITKEFDLAVA